VRDQCVRVVEQRADVPGSFPDTTWAIVTRSSTRRTLTRFASQTSRSPAAGPVKSSASGRIPRTSASGPSTDRMMSAIEISLAGFVMR
jgi:hypothetical protein